MNKYFVSPMTQMYITVIPRLARFLIARICTARICDPAQKYFHSTILYLQNIVLCKYFLEFFQSQYRLAQHKFHLTRFSGCHKKRARRGMTVMPTGFFEVKPYQSVLILLAKITADFQGRYYYLPTHYPRVAS